MKAEFKGTKGQWSISEIGYPDSKNQNTGRHHLNIDVDIWFGDTFESKTKGEAEANAKLIAAAPDLLDALLNIKNAYPDEDFKSWCDQQLTEITLHGSDFKLILDAINKALL